MSGVLRFSIINIYFFYNWFYALLSVDGMLNENKIHWRYDETEKMKFSDQENENAFPMSFFFFSPAALSFSISNNEYRRYHRRDQIQACTWAIIGLNISWADLMWPGPLIIPFINAFSMI